MKKELKSGLIVSCQAAEGEPLFGLHLMRYMARAAVAGGAVGIRALADEIAEIKQEVNVPVIGLVKRKYADSDVYITPTFAEIDEVLRSGADVIAMDATGRARPNGITLQELVAYARQKSPETLLMADTDTVENALIADSLGFDFVGTTMRGYTAATNGIKIPDYAFLKELKAKLKNAKLIAEGGVWETGELEKALACKPFAVVIGTAITRPKDITARFAKVFEKNERILCFDLGGTALKCAIVQNGNILRKEIISTDVTRGLDGIKETFAEGVKFFAGEEYAGVAVSSAGNIDSESGTVISATPLLPAYGGFDLRSYMESITHKPCVCLNDGFAALLGEDYLQILGDSAVMLTLGTGVGGAYLCGGKPKNIEGAGIGHVTLYENGRACNCGKRGCIEQYISGTALGKLLKENGVAEKDHAAMWNKYKAGDENVTRAVKTWLKDIRRSLDALYALRPFEVAVLGGGVAESAQYWFNDELFAGAPYRVRVSKGLNDAGLIGAYAFYTRGV